MSANQIASLGKNLPEAAPALAKKESGLEYNVPIGYLRAFVTVLVLAHHAVLAYHPFAPPTPASSLLSQPQWWRAFPVLDSQRSTGLALFAGFNDTFFMSLMFFLSGLFVWKSLQRKGIATFLRDRILKLGLPFIVAAALLAPLAYYPAYLMTGADPSPIAFWREWLSQGDWPSGPVWFVALLLVFDCAAALLFRLSPRWGEHMGCVASVAIGRPGAFLIALVAVSGIAYIPMALAFGPLHWTTVGPFAFQTSRLFHYAVWFFAGVILGAGGLERGLLAPKSGLARRWPVWVIAAVVAFVANTVIVIAAVSSPTNQLLGILGSFAFVVTCATAIVACLAVFLRFARARVTLMDSLRDNAYGIYLIHYALVVWLQYALLTAPLTAIAKGTIVFLGTMILSWIAIATIRRVPRVAKVI